MPVKRTYHSHMLGLEKSSGAGGFSVIPPAAKQKAECGPSDALTCGCVSVFLEGVFDFFTGLLQVRFDLIAFALGL
jgi:hypothetical protein